MGLLVLDYCLHNTIISANLQGLAWLAAGTFRQVKLNFWYILLKKFPLVSPTTINIIIHHIVKQVKSIKVINQYSTSPSLA